MYYPGHLCLVGMYQWQALSTKHISAVVDRGGMNGGANTGTKVLAPLVLSHAEKAMETWAEKIKAPRPAESRVHSLSEPLS